MPLFSGSYEFTYQLVADDGSSDTAVVSVDVEVGGTIAVRDSFRAKAGEPFEASVVANDEPGGGAVDSVTFLSGDVPPGLGLSTTGLLSGTPTAPGTYAFRYELKGVDGTTDPAPVTVVVRIAGTVAFNDRYTTEQRNVFSANVTDNDDPGGGAVERVELLSGSVPAGLTLAPDGTLSGAPERFGTFTFRYNLTGADGTTDPASVRLDITPDSTIASNDDYTGRVGESFTANVTRNDFVVGGQVDSVELVSGVVPPGLRFSSTGVLSGTPTRSGTYPFRYNLTGADGTSDPANVVVRVRPRRVVVDPDPPARPTYRRPIRQIEGGGRTPMVAVTRDPVQVSTGNFVLDETDLDFGAWVFGMEVGRFYNSAATNPDVLDEFGPPSLLGPGWRFSHQVVAVEADDGSVGVVAGDGRLLRFDLLDDGSFDRPDGFYGELRQVEGRFVIYNYDGTTWRFDEQGRMVQMTSPDGETVDVVYNHDEIESIDSSTGASYLLDYNNAGMIEAIRPTDGDIKRLVRFEYDSEGYLDAAFDPDGFATTYRHDGTGLITRIVDEADIVTVVNTYDSERRVATQKMPTGESTELAYAEDGSTTTVTITGDPGTGVARVDTFIYSNDEQGYTTGVVDSLDQEITVRRDENGEPSVIADREANEAEGSVVEAAQTIRTYDQYGNALSEIEPGIGTWTYEYSYTAKDTTTGEEIPLQRLVAMTEPYGGVTTYHYDGANTLPTRVEAPGGNTTINTITDGLVTSTVDADGVTTTFEYDERRQLVAVIDAGGSRISYDYDDAGRMTTNTDQNGQVATVTYDQSGRPITVTDRSGATTTRTYDPAGRLVEFADRLDNDTDSSRLEFNRSDTTGLVQEIIDQRSNTTGFTYNDFGEPTAETLPGGATWTSKWGELGRLRSISDPLPESRTTSFDYDVEGSLTEIVGQDETELTLDYDEADRPTLVKDPNGLISSFTYDDDTGQLTAEAFAVGTDNEIEISYTYDEANRLSTRTGPRPGETYLYEYTPAGRLESVTDPRGDTVTYRYDTSGRVSTYLLPDGLETKVHYNDRGDVTAVESPSGLRSELAYDDYGRITGAKSSGGVEVAYKHDADGALTSAQIGTDKPATFEMDALGLTAATDPNGGRSVYEYDGRNNLTKWVDQNGNPTTYTYDLADQLTSYTDPLGRTATYTYDDLGRLHTEQTPSGRIYTTSYDDGGRLTNIEFNDGTSRTYTYDELNRVTAINDQPTDSTVAYRYDQVGNIVEVTEPNGDTIGYSWDLVGNRTHVRYPSGATIDYTYDALSRLTTATHSEHGTTSYTYDIDSRLTNIEYPNGHTRTYAYQGELLTTYTDGDHSWDLAYDASGRITDINGADNWTYTYDHAGQLISADHANKTYSYSYDAVGNIVEQTSGNETTSYTHDEANQISTSITEKGETTFEHDADGRLIRETGPEDTTTNYAYDAEGRLTTVTTTELNASVTTWDRTYTPDGLLHSVETTSSDGQRRTWNLTWDRTFTVPKPLGWAGTDNIELTYGEGLDHIITSTGAEIAAINPLGDVIDGTTSAEGHFDPFGRNATDDQFGLGYRGELHTGPTINLKARDYIPHHGRFLTTDPLAPDPGLAASSAYAYAGNDPINFADPTGLSPTDNTLKDWLQKQLNDFSKGDAFRGIADAGLDRLKDIGDLAKMGLDLLSCGANKATFGLFGSCDKTKALIEGAKELFNSVATAIKNRNLKAVLDILGVFLPDRCQFSNFELDYCLGYATATAVITIVTGTGATKLFAKIKNLKKAKPKTLSEAADAADAIPGAPKPRPKSGCSKCRRCLTNSFEVGSQVLDADAKSTRPIETVMVGDLVWSHDLRSGSSEAKAVTAVIRSSGPEKDLVRIRTIDGIITATPDHLIWLTDVKRWAPASVIRPGDSLRTATGSTAEVQEVDRLDAIDTEVYNLSVDEFETYYVGAAAVLVHNIDCEDLGGAAAGFDIDELAQLAFRHSGGGRQSRPSLNQIREALKRPGTRIRDGLDGRDPAVLFSKGGVRVIINESNPLRSTAFFTD